MWGEDRIISYCVLRSYKSAEDICFVNYCFVMHGYTAPQRHIAPITRATNRQAATQSPQSLVLVQPHLFSRVFVVSFMHSHSCGRCTSISWRGLAKYGQSLMPMILFDFHFKVLRIVVRAVPSPCPTIGDWWLLVPATCKFGNSPPEGSHLKSP